ncbi:MAG: YraN family protein [Acidobacteriota bacterium]|nr:YraN family protein [Acidobacteriota bacterium]
MEPKTKTSYELGKSGESVALAYLKKKKYRILKKGFRLFHGEIDIIAFDRSTLVFIEVKTRRSTHFGLPEESVTPLKQQQIRKIAQGFLTLNNLDDVECRFDVLSLVYDGHKDYFIKHIKDAF